ncbi:nucleoid occlusion factor SlmA [Buttiauxella agrestis]
MAEKQIAKRNRREEILQSLAQMLESSDGSQRITTAKLAATVGVSEAALYRHFPSKTKMFDSLIEFIEDTLITRINLILKDEKDTHARLRLIVLLILGFGERNPGLTRILTGHALMFEQDRLQGRINQLFERIEVQLRQVMREKRCVKEKVSSPMNHCWQVFFWHFVKGRCRVLYVANSAIYRPMILIPAGRWLPHSFVN